jgi:hypothetical protein
MPTAFESATLNLKLFDLRREPVLREARQWFIGDFHPDSYDDVVTTVGGPRNTSFRMVVGYWEMAASMVTLGAIDADAFRAAHGEIYGMFCKIHPFLNDMRRTMNEPQFMHHVEQVVMGTPDATGIMDRRRARLRALAARRAEAERA